MAKSFLVVVQPYEKEATLLFKDLGVIVALLVGTRTIKEWMTDITVIRLSPGYHPGTTKASQVAFVSMTNHFNVNGLHIEGSANCRVRICDNQEVFLPTLYDAYPI